MKRQLFSSNLSFPTQGPIIMQLAHFISLANLLAISTAFVVDVYTPETLYNGTYKITYRNIHFNAHSYQGYTVFLEDQIRDGNDFAGWTHTQVEALEEYFTTEVYQPLNQTYYNDYSDDDKAGIVN
ncbi:unnamed protein product [Ambrosiozyma monospora]|uniref:Unnamed protein product n=1 Tax=Ambrosiozyma monospora TaxID=43982 RepID=A0ACB5U5J3_AMBMO|nr:unnamed protein product [Ambrosiozyma monospora]